MGRIENNSFYRNFNVLSVSGISCELFSVIHITKHPKFPGLLNEKQYGCSGKTRLDYAVGGK